MAKNTYILKRKNDLGKSSTSIDYILYQMQTPKYLIKYGIWSNG